MLGYYFFAKRAMNRGKAKSMRSFGDGAQLAAHISQKWKSLTEQQRRRYAVLAQRSGSSGAVTRNGHLRTAENHKHTPYALIMRLLYQEPFGTRFFSPEIASKIAARTNELLTDRDKASLAAHFGVKMAEPWTSAPHMIEVGNAKVPSATGNAFAFSSFAAMLEECVGKSDKEIFTSLSLLNTRMNPTPKSLHFIASKWEQIAEKPELREAYRPLGADSVRFERFCSTKARQYSPDTVPIAALFCQFRGLMWRGPTAERTVSKLKQKTLERISAIHRPKQPVERLIASFEALECVEGTFSGAHLTEAASPKTVQEQQVINDVDPKSYCTLPVEKVVPLAQEIAATRCGESVYDATIRHKLLAEVGDLEACS